MQNGLHGQDMYSVMPLLCQGSWASSFQFFSDIVRRKSLVSDKTYRTIIYDRYVSPTCVSCEDGLAFLFALWWLVDFLVCSVMAGWSPRVSCDVGFATLCILLLLVVNPVFHLMAVWPFWLQYDVELAMWWRVGHYVQPGMVGWSPCVLIVCMFSRLRTLRWYIVFHKNVAYLRTVGLILKCIKAHFLTMVVGKPHP